MKPGFKSLFRSIIATSVATIAGTYGADAAPKYKFTESQDDSHIEEQNLAKKDLTHK